MFLARFFGVWRASRRDEIAARRVPASRRDEIAPFRAVSRHFAPFRAISRRDAPRRARRPVKSWQEAPVRAKSGRTDEEVNLSSL